MRLVVNGLATELQVSTLAELLAQRNLSPRQVVVALNRDCIPRAQLDQTRLSEGDEIEILAPMQGG